MLRNAVGAFDAILGRGLLARRIAPGAVGRQAGSRAISTAQRPFGAPWQHRMGTSIAQLWTRNATKSNELWRMGRLRTSLQPPKRQFHTSKMRRNAQKTAEQAPKAEAEPTSLSARMKKLSKEYGWVAVGVYLSLSVLDFPFCFLLVRMVGTERISEIEHWVLSHVQKAIPESIKTRWNEYRKALKDAEMEQLGSNEISQDIGMVGWGVKEAEERNKTDASLATQLALAYAIHKSFIFIRVPLAAAVTPRVVKVLRGWGWQIGKQKAKKR